MFQGNYLMQGNERATLHFTNLLLMIVFCFLGLRVSGEKARGTELLNTPARLFDETSQGFLQTQKELLRFSTTFQEDEHSLSNYKQSRGLQDSLASDIFELPSEAVIIPAFENEITAFTFSSGFPDFGRRVEDDFNPKDFRVKIVELPNPEFGEVQLGADLKITVGDILEADTPVFFFPEPEFFNVLLRDEVVENPDVIDILVPLEEVCFFVEKFDPIDCRVVLTYQLVVEAEDGTSLFSTPFDANIYVQPKDDGNPVIEGETEVAVSLNSPARLAISTLTSDNGNELFNVRLRIQAIGGVEFEIPEEHSVNIWRNTSCVRNLCTDLFVTGIPSDLLGFVNTIDVFVDTLNLQVSDEDPVLKLVLGSLQLQDKISILEIKAVGIELGRNDSVSVVTIVSMLGMFFAFSFIILVIAILRGAESQDPGKDAEEVQELNDLSTAFIGAASNPLGESEDFNGDFQRHQVSPFRTDKTRWSIEKGQVDVI